MAAYVHRRQGSAMAKNLDAITNSREMVEGIPTAQIVQSKRIPWSHASRCEMARFAACHQLSKYTVDEVDLSPLVRALRLHRNSKLAMITKKIKSALLYLLENKVPGLSHTLNDEGLRRASWPEWSRRLTDDDWSGSIDAAANVVDDTAEGQHEDEQGGPRRRSHRVASATAGRVPQQVHEDADDESEDNVATPEGEQRFDPEASPAKRGAQAKTGTHKKHGTGRSNQIKSQSLSKTAAGAPARKQGKSSETGVATMPGTKKPPFKPSPPQVPSRPKSTRASATAKNPPARSVRARKTRNLSPVQQQPKVVNAEAPSDQDEGSNQEEGDVAGSGEADLSSADELANGISDTHTQDDGEPSEHLMRGGLFVPEETHLISSDDDEEEREEAEDGEETESYQTGDSGASDISSQTSDEEMEDLADASGYKPPRMTDVRADDREMQYLLERTSCEPETISKVSKKSTKSAQPPKSSAKKGTSSRKKAGK